MMTARPPLRPPPRPDMGFLAEPEPERVPARMIALWAALSAGGWTALALAAAWLFGGFP